MKIFFFQNDLKFSAVATTPFYLPPLMAYLTPLEGVPLDFFSIKKIMFAKDVVRLPIWLWSLSVFSFGAAEQNLKGISNHPLAR